jgi:aldose 1-epimerase
MKLANILFIVFLPALCFSQNKIKKESFGKLADGTAVDIYTLRNSKGMEARIMTYGASIVSLKVPDRDDKFEDVVLGYDQLEGYEKRNPLFGAVVGRYANRIKNGLITINGKEYQLPKNNGKNHIHGGNKNFSTIVWKAKPLPKQNALNLSYFSKDGEEGFPGNLRVNVIYTLTENDELSIKYFARTDKPTVINLTNHAYFNLAGQGNGNVLKHKIFINATQFTPSDQELIPTGEIRKVKGTPFDFTVEKEIGADIDGNDDQLKIGNGYDHNFVLNKKGKSIEQAARVYEPQSGRVMEVLTTEPGVQLFTAPFFDGKWQGKSEKLYQKNGGFCLETQHFPDSPNRPTFPSTQLHPGKKFTSETVFKFSVK